MAVTRRAVVIGSGPNGLTAAIVMAKAGVKTTVLEAHATPGGALRSAEWTQPGFIHDVGSAVHPLAISSPILSTFPLEQHGLRWVHSPSFLAHPFEDGTAALLDRSLEDTAERLGADGATYRRVIKPLVDRWSDLREDVLAPLRWPHYPGLLTRFGMLALWPAKTLGLVLFHHPEMRALFAGNAAHSTLPLERPVSSAFGWVLMIAGHAAGWPIPQGGAQSLTNALISYFKSLGGSVVTGHRVRTLHDVPEADTILADVTPRQWQSIAGDVLPAGYLQALRAYRYGPGVFKVDWALNAPIPWRAEACRRAITVHLGGTIDEIAASERAPWNQQTSAKPFVLLAQPSLFDAARAPQGRHTAWAYCHVPNGSKVDMTELIEAQVERFAPGFRQTILARHVMSPAALEQDNNNLVGGDINGGALTLDQLIWRPTRHHYRTRKPGLYLCSSSTPPGGGVHGMCGFYAAQAALADGRSSRSD